MVNRIKSFREVLIDQVNRTPFVELFCNQFRTEISEPACRTSKPTLRILQWNADGLSTKAQELRDRLAAESIGVCV